MSDRDIVFVCNEPTADGLGSWCGRELERHDQGDGLVLWVCPDHGQRGFFLHGGTLDLSEVRQS